MMIRTYARHDDIDSVAIGEGTSGFKRVVTLLDPDPGFDTLPFTVMAGETGSYQGIGGYNECKELAKGGAAFGLTESDALDSF